MSLRKLVAYKNNEIIHIFVAPKYTEHKMIDKLIRTYAGDYDLYLVQVVSTGRSLKAVSNEGKLLKNVRF